jgi:chaperonin GroES
MAHDGGGPRRRRQERLAPQDHPVDRLQHQRLGFDGHGADGTVVAVAGADPKLPIKMLNDRLLVKIPREDGERKTTGGILIPATAQVAKRLVWAEVMGVGQNVRTVQIGDHVLFSPEDRYEVEVRGDDYLILRERDIHAVAAERVEGSTGLYL